MVKHLFAAAIAAALIAAPVTASYAQQTAPADKADTKKAKKSDAPAATAAKKELTPQQQKMKDCSAKWGDYKKEKKVSGKTEHNKFMSGCLKG